MLKRALFVFVIWIALTDAAKSQNDSLHLRLFTPDELKQDLDSLYKIITGNHPDLWKYADKISTDKVWHQAKKRISQPMTRWEFIKIVAPLVNQYQDGHTNLSFDFDYPEVESVQKNNGKWFPYKVFVGSEKVWITDDMKRKQNDFSGWELSAVNGVSIKKILKELKLLIAGDYEANKNASMSRLFPFFLWAVYGWDHEYSMTLKNLKGETKVVKEQGLSVDDYFANAFPKNDWSMQVIEDAGLAVIECRSYRNEKAARHFIDSAFAVIRQRNISSVAFDLRRNGGGSSAIGNYLLSYITTRPFTDVVSKTIRDAWLLNRFKKGSWMNNMLVSYREEGTKNGNLYTKAFGLNEPDSVTHPENIFRGSFYLLTGPATYSSAHMTALAVKCYGLGKIIGLPTGERIDLTGESIGFSLPHTKLYGYCATAVYKAACGDPAKMGVQPDIIIESSGPDAVTGKDAVIEYLKAAVRD